MYSTQGGGTFAKNGPESRGMPVNSQRWIAVLGQQDEPTDAVEDYCHLLAKALQEKGRSLEISRVRWAQLGWGRALRDFRRRSAPGQGDWALVQYTGLAWSRRGFPARFVGLIRYLKRLGMNVAIVFHDPQPFGGHRLRDRARDILQLNVMRRSARLADKIVSTISPDCALWMQAGPIRTKVLCVPVGSNVSTIAQREEPRSDRTPVVIVFGMSGNAREEASTIAQVVARAAESLGWLRLIVFGRGAKAAEAILRESLKKHKVDLEIFDLVSSEQAGTLLASSDVQLFIRGGISSRRGSAIAAIVCGLPIVGFASDETAYPITEAGVRLVPVGDADGLVRELVSVLHDEALRETLRQRNLEATRQYFTWERIAQRYLSAIG